MSAGKEDPVELDYISIGWDGELHVEYMGV